MQREQSENDNEKMGSEILEGSKFFRPTVQFKGISFQNFYILMDGALSPNMVRCSTQSEALLLVSARKVTRKHGLLSRCYYMDGDQSVGH